MSIVSAYTELPPGQEPSYLPLQQEGLFGGKTAEGLTVDWGYPEPPEEAQVYLYWVPKVVAVWNDEGEENGEDREDSDGSNPVERDEAVPAESDLGTGEGGERYGDVPAAGTGGGAEAVE